MAKNFESSTSSKIINPLLSTSNTITLDDFSNKPFLLPAAPIVIPKPVDLQPKELVTVGETPEIDLNTLSEINLNINQDEEQLNSNTINYSTDPFPQIQHEPLQHYPVENTDDSIISQAASSFSQLPSVASTVLSTFSKVIHNYTPGSREVSSERDLNLNQQQSQPDNSIRSLNLVPDNNFNNQQNITTNNPVDVKPPIFFKPTELERKSPGPILPPPLTAVSNTYRLTTKKKTYAQFPGLATHIDNHILPNNPESIQPISSAAVSLPLNQPILGETTAFHNSNLIQTQQPAVKEEKKSNLFSTFSNIVPPVLQNLTGFVKSISPVPLPSQVDQSSTFNSPAFTTPLVNQNFPNINQNNNINFEGYQTLPSHQSVPSQPPVVTPPPSIPVPKSGASSFRLQKGTKLYKSAFDPNSVISPKQQEIPLLAPQIGCTVNSNLVLPKVEAAYTTPQNIFVPPPIDTNLTAPQFDQQQNSDFSSENLLNQQVLSGTGYENIQHSSNFLISQQPELAQPNQPLISDWFAPSTEQGIQFLQNSLNNNTEASTQLRKEVNIFPSTLNREQSKIPDQSNEPKSFLTPVKSQLEPDLYSTPPPPPPVIQTTSIPSVFKAAPNYPPPPIEAEALTNLETESFPIPNTATVTTLPPAKELFCPSNLSDNQASNPFRRASTPSSKVIKTKNPSSQISSLFNPVLAGEELDSNFFTTETALLNAPDKEIDINQTIEPIINLPRDQKDTEQTKLVTTPSGLNFEHQTKSITEKNTGNLRNYFAQNFNESNTCVNKKLSESADIQKFSNNILDNNLNNIEKYSPEKLSDSSKEDNTFTNYFTSTKSQITQINKNQTNLIPPKTGLPSANPSSFFDTFTNSGILESTVEDPNSQRIQNFFNNPPQQDNNISCLDYNLKRNIIQNKPINQLSLPENRSNSPLSNIVEPPASSGCSEFSSELNSTIGLLHQSDQEKLPIVNLCNKSYLDEIPDDLLEEFKKMATTNNTSSKTNVVYQPAVKHWFFKQAIDTKFIWVPFSYKDSNNLEENLANKGSNIVQVEGGRHDVNIAERTKTPVYWNGKSCEVKRCSWFYKAIDSKYIPYEEDVADLLENEYRNASNLGEWHQKILLGNGDTVVFHGPTVIVHFFQSQTVDAWGGASSSTTRPRVVKRDLDDLVIEPGESNKVDHLLFMIHGIGSACDLKFRNVEEVVEEFRSIAYQLVQSHYKNSCDSGDVGRIEVLPISWHAELHNESGIDEKLKAITLESIPKFRNFANDTVLDVLFYTSPVFCQSIINTVANSLNDVYTRFCQRNHEFSGQVSLAGHSLGSLILFDLLCHQKPIEDNDQPNSENPDELMYPLSMKPSPTTSKQITYTIGQAGTGQPYISYPQLLFAPKKFFALGSPIGMFVTIRGLDSLGLDFQFPTCPGFYNIFHPYDPVAYRIESLINPELKILRPVLIPHHKGRKRMHLELKETVSRVGAEVKQRILDTFKSTMDSVFFLSTQNKITEAREIEKEVDKVLEMQLKIDQPAQVPGIRSRTNSDSTCTSDNDASDLNLLLGKLNSSKRIDYVLQEAPLEFFNEYLFALTSHVCYWESEDTILFVIKEIYSSLGVKTDSQIPQQSMTIERPASENSLLQLQSTI